jgi:hypothetical protein
MEEFTQIDQDFLADIIWWIKGYQAGAKDNFEECPFDMNHAAALAKARTNLQMIIDGELVKKKK